MLYVSCLRRHFVLETASQLEPNWSEYILDFLVVFLIMQRSGTMARNHYGDRSECVKVSACFGFFTNAIQPTDASAL